MGFANSSKRLEGEIMKIVTLGIDLIKNIFVLHGVDAGGKVTLQCPTVKRIRRLRHETKRVDTFWAQWQ